MPISFSNVSPSYRASKVFVEMAGEKKSLASLFIPPCILLVGMYDPLKTATVDYVPIKVVSADDVGLKAGFGSHAHRQALRFPPAVFLQGNGVYWMPIPEKTAGTAADMNVTFGGSAATTAGTFYFGVGGELVAVPVAVADTPSDVAKALEDEITAIRDIAVVADSSAAITMIDAKFKGTLGNQILIIPNPAGESQSAENPSGITVTLENVDGYLSGGATDPEVDDGFFNSDGTDKLGDRWYTHITMPFTDATNLAHYKAIAALRADPAVNRFFGAYAGYTAEKTYTQALALPATFNNKYLGQIFEDEYYAPAFELSAELVGIMADEMNVNPSRPYKTVALSGLSNPDKLNRRYVENDALFRAGMSYCDMVSGTLQLGDIALTYRTNPSGGAATDWFDAVSLHRRQAKAYSIEQLFKTEKYQRSVVVSNSDVTAIDYAIAPKDVIADLTKLISDLWIPYGWTKNGDEVIASLTAEINSGYESRIDAKVTDDEAQALRIIAVKYAFLY